MKLSVNRVSTTFGLAYWVYQGFTRINGLITDLLTTFIAKNTMHNRKNTDSKLIEIASCTACRPVSLVVKNNILVRYDKLTAKTGAFYEWIDGPARRPTDNPPNSDRLGVYHRTPPGLAVQVYLQPEQSICQWFRSDSDPDPK
jgi:hypothetical protein